MGFFSSIKKIGSKLIGGAKVGGRILQRGAKIGMKVAGTVGNAMDSVSRIPLLSPMTGHPAFQAMRGLVGGVQRIAPKVQRAGTIAEGVSRRAERVTGLRGDPMTLGGVGAKAAGLPSRTNVGATGRQSVGEATIV